MVVHFGSENGYENEQKMGPKMGPKIKPKMDVPGTIFTLDAPDFTGVVFPCGACRSKCTFG